MLLGGDKKDPATKFLLSGKSDGLVTREKGKVSERRVGEGQYKNGSSIFFTISPAFTVTFYYYLVSLFGVTMRKESERSGSVCGGLSHNSTFYFFTMSSALNTFLLFLRLLPLIIIKPFFW